MFNRNAVINYEPKNIKIIQVMRCDQGNTYHRPSCHAAGVLE